MKSFITNLVPRLPEIGKIKIGGLGAEKTSAKGNKFRMPEKYDYFKITKNEKDNAGDFILDTKAHEILGEKPTEIPVRLLFNDITLSWQCRYVRYDGSKLIGRGDGETFEMLINNKWEQIDPPIEQLDPAYDKLDKWKISGVFSCLLDISSAGVGGIWRFRTTSYNSCMSIQASLALIASQTAGYMAGLPLKMVVHNKAGVNPKTGQPVKVPVVHIEFRGTIEGLQSKVKTLINNIKHIEMLEKGERLALETSGDTYFSEDDTVSQEFFPEQHSGAKNNSKSIETVSHQSVDLGIEDAEEVIADVEIPMEESDYKLLLDNILNDECGFIDKTTAQFFETITDSYQALYNDKPKFEGLVIKFITDIISKSKPALTKKLSGTDLELLENLPNTYLEIVARYRNLSDLIKKQ
jgi:hypothetical protein